MFLKNINSSAKNIQRAIWVQKSYILLGNTENQAGLWGNENISKQLHGEPFDFRAFYFEKVHENREDPLYPFDPL